ncbi:MAG: 4Fe-4S dicluster domain-containing protein [Coriobacteriales bacterium]|jgi:ferredoxin
MNKIETIETISDALGKSTISLEPKRCSYIRNWNSKCRACLNACPHESIARSLGHLKIDPETCTDCGSCVSACPTSTFTTHAPNANELVRQAKECAQANGGTARFVCTLHSYEHNVDPTKAVVLPCLDYLDEYLMTGLFAVGIKKVELIGTDCSNCELNSSEPYFPHAVKSARSLLELWSINAPIDTVDEIDPALCLKGKAHATIASDRRGAFKEAGASAMGFLAQALNDVIAGVTGEEVEHEDPDKQIIVKLDEVFPPDTYRSIRMLRMLDHLGKRPYGATVESRFWAHIDIDENRCRHCGACARMCVTRALTYEEDSYGRATLSFRPSLCINCALCKDSCLTHSMVYTNKVLADDLDSDVVKHLFENVEKKDAAGHPFL